MASVAEVKQAIQQATEQAGQSVQLLSQASSMLDQATAILTQVSQGSGHDLLGRAAGLLQQAKEEIDNVNTSINAAGQTASEYSSLI